MSAQGAITTKLALVSGHVKVAGVFTARNAILIMECAQNAVATLIRLVTSKRVRLTRKQFIPNARDVATKKRILASGDAKIAGVFTARNVTQKAEHAPTMAATLTGSAT